MLAPLGFLPARDNVRPSTNATATRSNRRRDNDYIVVLLVVKRGGVIELRFGVDEIKAANQCFRNRYRVVVYLLIKR